jgi:hypothetical protein
MVRHNSAGSSTSTAESTAAPAANKAVKTTAAPAKLPLSANFTDGNNAASTAILATLAPASAGKGKAALATLAESKDEKANVKFQDSDAVALPDSDDIMNDSEKTSTEVSANSWRNSQVGTPLSSQDLGSAASFQDLMEVDLTSSNHPTGMPTTT